MLKLSALVFLASFIAAAGCSPISTLSGAHWAAFKQRFNKTYNDQTNDEQVHRQQWEHNLQHINSHNERFNLGLTTFTLGVNQFTDMSSAEFVAFFNGLRLPTQKRVHSQIHPVGDVVIPDTVDWRTKKVVTPVKNQQQCGSCWAFSATGSLEGQHALKSKKLISLSEQNLVDCSSSEGNNGCNGGLMDDAFQYVKDNKGIDTESSYPYTAEDGSCSFKSNAVGATLKSWTDVEAGSESALTNAIATVGPISVAIDASNPSFQSYSSGVYYEDSCSSSQLDHGVLAVGYGKTDGSEYYLVKNSWGAGWGMDGYIMMSRNKDNNCGIATMSSYPVV